MSRNWKRSSLGPKRSWSSDGQAAGAQAARGRARLGKTGPPPPSPEYKFLAIVARASRRSADSKELALFSPFVSQVVGEGLQVLEHQSLILPRAVVEGLGIESRMHAAGSQLELAAACG